MLTVCMCSRLRDQPLSDKAFDTLGDLLRGMQHRVSFQPCKHLDVWIAVLSSVLSLTVLCNLYLLVHSAVLVVSREHLDCLDVCCCF